MRSVSEESESQISSGSQTCIVTNTWQRLVQALTNQVGLKKSLVAEMHHSKSSQFAKQDSTSNQPL